MFTPLILDGPANIETISGIGTGIGIESNIVQGFHAEVSEFHQVFSRCVMNC